MSLTKTLLTVATLTLHITCCRSTINSTIRSNVAIYKCTNEPLPCFVTNPIGAVFSSILSTLTLIAHCVILIIMWRKYIKYSLAFPNMYFILVSLSLSDMIYTVFISFAIHYARHINRFIQLCITLRSILTYCTISMYSVSILTISFLAVDRCLSYM